MTTRTLYPSAIRIPLPHVQQHANFTCGPAVLHSILSFYSVAGHDHSKTAAMCGSDPTDGTPPRAIAKAARQHGLNVTVQEHGQPQAPACFAGAGDERNGQRLSRPLTGRFQHVTFLPNAHFLPAIYDQPKPAGSAYGSAAVEPFAIIP